MTAAAILDFIEEIVGYLNSGIVGAIDVFRAFFDLFG